MLSNIMMQLGNHKNAAIEESMVRHMVLNSLRSYRTKFKNQYGELVIACDNKQYWRREVYPYYKANRKKNRENSELDWKVIFECLHKIRDELKETFPYPVLDIEGAEADDIIGSLCKYYDEKILILSGDHDFVQLQVYPNVSQYDPIRKRNMSSNDPKLFLHEHIMKGDSGDGIPNFLSNDNCFVIGERQKPLTEKKLEVWRKQQPEEFCNEIMLRNYKRNQQLIDLTKIPENIYNNIIQSFESQKNKKSKDLLNYFIKNKLKHLVECIGDFV